MITKEEAIEFLTKAHSYPTKMHSTYYNVNIYKVLEYINQPTTLDSDVEEVLINRIIEEMNSSIFNEEGTIDCIIEDAIKEIDNINKPIDAYELKAYTMNVIKQCQNFIKTTKGGPK